MSKYFNNIVFLLVFIGGTFCHPLQAARRRAKSAITGALVGGALGAGIGAAASDSGAGAGIGFATGATVGGITGAALAEDENGYIDDNGYSDEYYYEENYCTALRRENKNLRKEVDHLMHQNKILQRENKNLKKKCRPHKSRENRYTPYEKTSEEYYD